MAVPRKGYMVIFGGSNKHPRYATLRQLHNTGPTAVPPPGEGRAQAAGTIYAPLGDHAPPGDSQDPAVYVEPLAPPEMSRLRPRVPTTLLQKFVRLGTRTFPVKSSSFSAPLKVNRLKPRVPTMLLRETARLRPWQGFYQGH